MGLADDVDLMNQLDAAKKEAVSLDKLKPRDFADIYFEDTKRVRTPVYVEQVAKGFCGTGVLEQICIILDLLIIT